MRSHSIDLVQQRATSLQLTTLVSNINYNAEKHRRAQVPDWKV